MTMRQLRITVPTDQKRDRRARVRGKTTGVGFRTFIVGLFRANEQLPPTQRLTDQQLQDILAAEFPHSKLVQKIVARRYGVQQLRYAYNRGDYTNGRPPKPPSRRYAAGGLPADPRTGKPLADQSWLPGYGQEPGTVPPNGLAGTEGGTLEPVGKATARPVRLCRYTGHCAWAVRLSADSSNGAVPCPTAAAEDTTIREAAADYPGGGEPGTGVVLEQTEADVAVEAVPAKAD